MKYQRNTVPKLAFTDDWMFSMVMRDEDICRELLTRILPNEQFGPIHLANLDGTFSEEDQKKQRDQAEQQGQREQDNKQLYEHRDEYWDNQHQPGIGLSNLSHQMQAALKFGSENHGVRFDAYVQSEELWAEIEMQVYHGDHLGKRSRYYCANMDVDMLMSGADYKDLKKSYVIFICTYDYMKKGEPVYFFQRFDVEKQLPFNDESYILILNTSCDPAKVPENLKALYAYVNDPANTSDDALMQKIDGQVEKYNGSEWRWMQVTFEEHVKHIAYLAKEEGREEGEKNMKNMQREIAAKLKATGMAPADIADATGLNLEEIEAL